MPIHVGGDGFKSSVGMFECLEGMGPSAWRGWVRDPFGNFRSCILARLEASLYISFSTNSSQPSIEKSRQPSIDKKVFVFKNVG